MSNRSTRVVETRIDSLATQVSLEFVAKPENQIIRRNQRTTLDGLWRMCDTDGLERKKTGVNMV